tara:strand:+ start:206 stop:406 length:201 start_codon:yes stop_codon:yes gene_type:complete
LKTKIIQINNDNNRLDFCKSNTAIKNAIFEQKSKLGINEAGITNRLDNTYIILARLGGKIIILALP